MRPIHQLGRCRQASEKFRRERCDKIPGLLKFLVWIHMTISIFHKSKLPFQYGCFFILQVDIRAYRSQDLTLDDLDHGTYHPNR